MIKLVLALYLLLFPQCELMVSWLDDFWDCNNSIEDIERCYANSAWDYGGASTSAIDDDPVAMWIVWHLPLVRTASCWR